MDWNASRFEPLAELELGEEHSVFDLLAANRERFLVPVRQPLLLVTQIQRSGGTLTSQLLDGHSQIHMHPSELHIGKPKYVWPSINLDAPPMEIFAALREGNATRHARTGYLKVSGAELSDNPNHRKFILPFIFVDALQERLFVSLLKQQPPRSQRGVLDHYATSYFNAWLDYADLYRDPTTIKYWAAFVARFLIRRDNADRFFRDYPDGRMLVPVRDPVSWYASASEHSREYADLDAAIDLWLRCNKNAVDVASRFADRVVLFRFEDLVEHTRTTVTALLQRLGLSFEQGALEPTFNRIPIVSDSSFGAKYGIDRSALSRAGALDPAVQEHIRRRTAGTFAALRAKADILLPDVKPPQASRGSEASLGP